MILFHNLDFFDKDGNNLNLEKIYKVNVDIVDSNGSGADIKVTTNPDGQLENFIINSGGKNYSPNTKIIIEDNYTNEKYEIYGEEFIKINSSGAITNIIIPIKKSGFSFPYVIYKGNLFFNHISTGLIESEHIYITEYAKDPDKKDLYIHPRNYKLSDNSYSEYLYIDVYGDDEEIFLYEIEDKSAEFPTIIKTNDKKLELKNGLDDILDKSLTRKLSKKLNSVSQLNLGVKSKEEGIFERKLRIGIEYKDKIFIFTEIELRAEVTGEDDRLKNMLDNFGFSISSEEVKIFRDSDVNETLPDYNLLNEKRKEMLLEYHNIFPYIGSYKGLVNILKYFDYGDLRLKEYWLNTELTNREEHIKKTKKDQKIISRIPEISQKRKPISDHQMLKNLIRNESEIERIKLEKPISINNLTKFLNKYKYLPNKKNKRKLDFEQKRYKQVNIPLDLKGKGRNWEDEEFLPTGSWKKTSLFSLHYDINKESGQVDNFGIPIVEDAFMFTHEETLIKLFSLREYLKEKFLPLNAKIIDIVGEGIYFERYATNIWEDGVQTTYINKEYIPDFDIDSSFIIEDLHNYKNQIENINKEVSIRKYYGYNVFNFMETDNIAKNQKGPIGCLVNLNADKFDITWSEMGITWDELIPDKETETDILELEFDTSISTGNEEEKKIVLPFYGYVNVTVNWGDGNIEYFTNEGNVEHVYKYHNIYNIKIYGTLDQFGNGDESYESNNESYESNNESYESNNESYESNKKLLKVHSFGNLKLKSLSGAFHTAENLTEIPNKLPDTVTDISYLFKKTTKFNNKKIIYWDVSNITTMEGMFEESINFNQNIGNWITTNVTDMSYMFKKSEKFNQDIGNWDVSNVTDMTSMFEESLRFNQDISNWNIKNVNYMNNMFTDVKLSTGIYNNILIKWSKLDVQKNVTFDVGNSNYSPGLPEDSRVKLKKNWTINDGSSTSLPAVLTDKINYELGSDNKVNIIMYGETTFDGGIDITKRGFKIYGNEELTWEIRDEEVDDGDIGKYNKEISLSNQDLYIRAYAINSTGTPPGWGYGRIIKFEKIIDNDIDDKEHEINSWDTVGFAEFHEIEWRFTYERPQKYSTSIRKKLIDGKNITARLPYIGKYNVEMLLFDMTNNCIKINKNIDIGIPEVEFIMLSRFLHHKETWDDLEKHKLNWNNVGGEWRNCGIMNSTSWDDLELTWDDLELEKYKIESAEKQFPKHQTGNVLRITEKDKYAGALDYINFQDNNIILMGQLKSPKIRDAKDNIPQDYIYFKRNNEIYKSGVIKVEYINDNKTLLELDNIPNNINLNWRCLREIGRTILVEGDIRYNELTRKKGLKEKTWIKFEKENLNEKNQEIEISDILKNEEDEVNGIILEKDIRKKINSFGKIYKIRNINKDTDFKIKDTNKIELNYTPEEDEILPGFTVLNMTSEYEGNDYKQRLLVEHWNPNTNIIETKELDGDFSINTNATIKYDYWDFVVKIPHYFIDDLDLNEITLNFNDYPYCENFITSTTPDSSKILNGEWYFDYQDRTGSFSFYVHNIGFENGNTLITLIDEESSLFKISTDFEFSWTDFDEDYAQKRIGIDIHNWENMWGIKWDDLYHLQWNQFEYSPGASCGFEISKVQQNGTIQFNEFPEFTFSKFEDLETEIEIWEKALEELQNTDNEGLSRFNFRLKNLNTSPQSYIISATAKNQNIDSLGYILFDNGVEGVYDDPTSSHTYPMGYYNKWNEPHLFGYDNLYANWKPLARTYYEYGYDNLKNKGWYPANIYKTLNGVEVKTTYKPKKIFYLTPQPEDLNDPIYGMYPNLLYSVDWRFDEGMRNLYDHTISSPFNWNDIFVSKHPSIFKPMTTIFLLSTNCKIAAKKKYLWEIKDRISGEIICKTIKRDLIWTFTYKSIFDISLQIEDINGNKNSITKNGLIIIE